MRYTQLDFSPYSPKRRSLVSQAEFLVREMVAERIHEYPCSCGACIYWAYRHSKKGEGRQFSARTFLIYFLRSDFFNWTRVENPVWWYRGVKQNSDILTYSELKAESKYLRHPKKLGTNLYWDRVRRAARLSTRTCLEELLRRPQPPSVKAFLLGILHKKSFYIYYDRAGNPSLERTVKSIHRQILFMRVRKCSRHQSFL